MPPWVQDGSAQCDILAGGVDESGLFKGIYVSGVHLMALLRTFQLSKVFMPCDVPTPVGAIGQSLQDGVPIIIVTRGCFGRTMDYGPGPVRNDVQKTIWQTARDMRGEMPQIYITCIDIPINLSSDVLQDLTQEPLNEYRELMYQDGTWYTPHVVNAAPLGKWMMENPRAAKTTVSKGKLSKGEVTFQRKKFDWQDTTRHYANMWIMSWRPVMEARPAPETTRRTDLVFYPGAIKTESQPVKLAPSAPAAKFAKGLAAAREAGDAQAMLDAADAYLGKAALKETESLEEATKACDEAGDIFKAKSQAKEAFSASKLKFRVLVSMGKADEAMTVAKEAFSSASSASLKAEALKLVVTSHQTLGDLTEAIAVAKSGKDDIAKMGDEEATCEACEVVVTANLAKGDTEAAIAAATESTSASGKVGAAASALLGQALMAKAEESDIPGPEARSAAQEAAAAHKKAASQYGSLQMKAQQATALKAAGAAYLRAAEFTEAVTVAKELQGLGDAEKAAGLELTSKALQGSTSASPGGAEEMVASAYAALEAHKAAGSAEGEASSSQVVALALVASDGDMTEAYMKAKASAAGFKALNKTQDMCTSLLTAAKAAMKKSSLNSAYWDAKQVLSESAPGATFDEALSIVNQASRASEEMEKPLGVGGPVPVNMGDAVTYV